MYDLDYRLLSKNMVLFLLIRIWYFTLARRGVLMKQIRLYHVHTTTFYKNWSASARHAYLQSDYGPA